MSNDFSPISIKNLRKDFRHKIFSKKGAVVKNLSLDLNWREIFGLLGPNGAGKTTTIKMICGLIKSTEGIISICGYDIAKKRKKALQHIGVVLEGNRNIYWQLSPYQNLHYFGSIKGVQNGGLRDRIEYLLDFFDLSQKRDISVKNLSRGMQQKLALSIALISDPDVLLLDEPTLGLDIYTTELLKEKISYLSEYEGKAVILTTHQTDLAQDLCHRIGLMKKGQLVSIDFIQKKEEYNLKDKLYHLTEKKVAHECPPFTLC